MYKYITMSNNQKQNVVQLYETYDNDFEKQQLAIA